MCEDLSLSISLISETEIEKCSSSTQQDFGTSKFTQNSWSSSSPAVHYPWGQKEGLLSTHARVNQQRTGFSAIVCTTLAALFGGIPSVGIPKLAEVVDLLV